VPRALAFGKLSDEQRNSLEALGWSQDSWDADRLMCSVPGANKVNVDFPFDREHSANSLPSSRAEAYPDYPATSTMLYWGKMCDEFDSDFFSIPFDEDGHLLTRIGCERACQREATCVAYEWSPDADVTETSDPETSFESVVGLCLYWIHDPSDEEEGAPTTEGAAGGGANSGAHDGYVENHYLELLKKQLDENCGESDDRYVMIRYLNVSHAGMLPEQMPYTGTQGQNEWGCAVKEAKIFPRRADGAMKIDVEAFKRFMIYGDLYNNWYDVEPPALETGAMYPECSITQEVGSSCYLPCEDGEVSLFYMDEYKLSGRKTNLKVTLNNVTNEPAVSMLPCFHKYQVVTLVGNIEEAPAFPNVDVFDISVCSWMSPGDPRDSEVSDISAFHASIGIEGTPQYPNDVCAGLCSGAAHDYGDTDWSQTAVGSDGCGFASAPGSDSSGENRRLEANTSLGIKFQVDQQAEHRHARALATAEGKASSTLEERQAELVSKREAVKTACVAPPYETQKCATKVYLDAQIAAAAAGTDEAVKKSSSDPCNCLPECVSTAFEMRVSSTKFPSDTSDDVHDYAVTLCRMEMHESLTGVFRDVTDEYGNTIGCNSVCQNNRCTNVNNMYEDVFDNQNCHQVTMAHVVSVIMELQTWIEKPITTDLRWNDLPPRFQIFPTALPGNSVEDHGKANENNEDVWCPPRATNISECAWTDKDAVLTLDIRSRLQQKMVSQKRALEQLVDDVRKINFSRFDHKHSLRNFIRGTCGAAHVDWDLQSWKQDAPRARYVEKSIAAARSSALSISIYYGSPDEEISTVGKKMTTMDFFGGVGGMFGLLCGMSVLTMFEMFEFVCSMFVAFFFPWAWFPCCKKREGRKQHAWAAKNATNKECAAIGGAFLIWFLSMFFFLKLTIDFDPDSIEPPL
jgi:hypothetical protein